MTDFSSWKKDNRPKKGLWAPGDYLNYCVKCHDKFIGDKRALYCADCTYEGEDDGKDLQA